MFNNLIYSNNVKKVKMHVKIRLLRTAKNEKAIHIK